MTQEQTQEQQLHRTRRIWRIAPVSYWGVVWFIRLCMFIYTRSITVQGLENVPKNGGVILVSNHLNNADPCIIPGVMKRRIVSMAKKEMFRWPLISLIFRFIGAFPVDRQGADLAALREAQNVVNSGLMLLMFPEGTRSRDHQLHRGYPGSALIAYRTAAPIIPVGITGTESLQWPLLFLRPFLGPRVKVRVGKPFQLPPVQRVNGEAARAGTDVIMRKIAELLPASYRGEYADDTPESSPVPHVSGTTV